MQETGWVPVHRSETAWLSFLLRGTPSREASSSSADTKTGPCRVKAAALDLRGPVAFSGRQARCRGETLTCDEPAALLCAGPPKAQLLSLRRSARLPNMLWRRRGVATSAPRSERCPGSSFPSRENFVGKKFLGSYFRPVGSGGPASREVWNARQPEEEAETRSITANSYQIESGRISPQFRSTKNFKGSKYRVLKVKSVRLWTDDK